jgi:hypothetical protein
VGRAPLAGRPSPAPPPGAAAETSNQLNKATFGNSRAPARIAMRTLILFALLSSAYGADPQEIFKAAAQNYDRDHLAALRYSYTETEEGSNGKSVSQITVIEGTPYERVISKNGKPLTPDAEKHEEQKYKKALAERAHETAAQRQKRINKYQSDVKIFQEAPNAFVAHLLPDDSISGRAAYVLELTPNPSYQPENIRSKILTKIQAKVWIDKQDLRIVRANATVIDTVAIGWFLARVSKGGHLEMEQTRLPDGIWVPREFVVTGRERLLLVDEKKLNQTVTFDGFQQISREPAGQVTKK